MSPNEITIPITRVSVGTEEEALVLQVLRSGMLAQGPMVAEFEQRCRTMAGTEHAVAVSNGTVALCVALEALDLEPGAEVVTTPFTFAATLNAILRTGGVVRFADVRDDDFNIDPDAVDAVASGRTSVVVPVHLYGQTADMAPIVATAGRIGARILEDAAQAHGASYHGRAAGSFDVATFSFYATKNLMAGEGGVITTDDERVAERARVLRNQGMRSRYDYVESGLNHRLTDLAAAVAIPQFDRLDDIASTRGRIAAYYRTRFAGLDGLISPVVMPGRAHVWHQFTLRCDAARRDAVVADLNGQGIGAGVYYPRLVHDYDCFRDDPRIIASDTPVARRLATEVFSIPVHQYLTESETEQVADAVVRAVERVAADGTLGS